MMHQWPAGPQSRPVICLVTDRHRLRPPDTGALVRVTSSAAKAGVNLIQVRERDLDDRRLLALTRQIVAAARDQGAAVVVNDRIDVAIAGGADGVHLRADSVSPRRIRAIFPQKLLIGQSVHGAAEAVAAERAGADYLIVGTVYPTESKPEDAPLLGISGLEEVCRSVHVPVLAIGGITVDNAGRIAASGAAGIAAIRLFSDVLVADQSDQSLEATFTQLVARVRGAFELRSPQV
jgi:thiamine-phosphate pyrophosphorylase